MSIFLRTMNSPIDSLSLDRPWNEALEWLTRSLAREGLRPLRTFDLHDARAGAAICPCPRHGIDVCTCQMLVILVYGRSGQPATLVLHGSEEQTWLSLVDSPLQRVDPAMQALLERALRPGMQE